MTPPRPLEIIGGGLAGLALGLALRRSGVGVTIFEAGNYPRHRVCGEFIAGLSQKTAARLGLEPLLADALRHHEMAWFNSSGAPRIHRLPSPALGVSRFALDARLATAFVSAGGELKTNARITDPTPRAGRIIATGRRRGRAHWLGLKIHVRGISLLRPLEIHLGDEAYVGLSDVEDGALNLCGLFKRRPLSGHGMNLINAYLNASGLKALADRLQSAEIETASFSAVAAISFDRTVTRQSVVSLGDACAMVPPFTGNGMAMAFQSAEMALDPLLVYSRGEANWSDTCLAIHRLQTRRFRLRLASAHWIHPYLLQPGKQRWLAAFDRARLLPFRPLYAALH